MKQLLSKITCLTLLAAFICVAYFPYPVSGSAENVQTERTDDVLIYQKLFIQKRAEHHKAVSTLYNLDSMEKIQKMVQLLLARLFQVIEAGKRIMIEVGFLPGESAFPKEDPAREGLSNILENILFFADVLLRLPDVTHRLYDQNKEWQELALWSITFANETNFLDPVSVKVLNLMAQELRILERDPDYVNPFKKDKQTVKPKVPRPPVESTKDEKKKKRRQRLKGPRLSPATHTEL